MLDSNIITHNTGVYYTCYRLSCLNWKITSEFLTDKQQLHRIQRDGEDFVVKIRSFTNVVPVPFTQDLDILDHLDYLVICNNLQGQPNLIVMEPQTVRKVIHKDTKKEWTYWLQPVDYNRRGLDFEREFGEK